MDENHQDKIESKLIATEDRRWVFNKKSNLWVSQRKKPTGFEDKTLWDKLNLFGTLAIPLIIALATIGFGVLQLHLADAQHQSDQQSALDQQRATILQTYIDNIQDLLLHDNLLKSSLDPMNPYYDIAILARARTLTALPGLDPERKSLLVQFIYQAKLIFFDPSYKTNNPIIAIGEADLSGADFSHIFLVDADLSGANLLNANLSGTSLISANLNSANLNSASLTHAYLNGADLTNADLTNADLTNADLSGTRLYGAHVTNADLTNADLSGARNLTQQQLDQVLSCDGATLPKGLTCHHNQSPT